MQAERPTDLPWRLEDLPFASIDSARVASNEALIVLLCASSFIESGSDLYTSNLVRHFDGDAEVATWLSRHWEVEELQHGRALKTYIQHVWPEFDWDAAFRRFFEEYSKTCSQTDFEPSRALELVSRCVVETGTATLYRAISEFASEPVLKQLTENIRSDEVRHYKHFYQFFRKYNAVERNGRLAVLGALARRVIALKSDDSEIALRHVFQARHPADTTNRRHLRQLTSQVNALVRRNLSADMCIKMLLKPLNLPPRIQPGVQYPLTKITQHVIFR